MEHTAHTPSGIKCSVNIQGELESTTYTTRAIMITFSTLLGLDPVSVNPYSLVPNFNDNRGDIPFIYPNIVHYLRAPIIYREDYHA